MRFTNDFYKQHGKKYFIPGTWWFRKQECCDMRKHALMTKNMFFQFLHVSCTVDCAEQMLKIPCTVFLLINTPGRDAKHNEGGSILTLKQQNTVTKKNTICFFSKYVDCHIFYRFLKPVFIPGIILIWHIICLHSVLPVQCRQL